MYRLAEKFGWTPDQIDAMDARTLEKFLTIMQVEAQVRKSHG